VAEVIITNACADRCAKQLGITREKARTWLSGLIGQGRVTAELPPPHTGKRSRSGRFLLVDEVLALPLIIGDRGDFLANGCFFYPEWLKSNGLGGADVDPFRLRGRKLLTNIRFSGHCVQRYQERCGGDPDEHVALLQLGEALAADAHAVRKRPDWARSRNTADFFLVADDEYCLPVQRYASDGKAFEALTLLHRSGPLFELSGKSLEFACRFTDPVIRAAKEAAGPGRDPVAWLRQAVVTSGALSWHPPAGQRPYPKARFYLHAGGYYLPLAWEKDARRPLTALALRRSRVSLLRRAAAWLRRRFAPRVT
jgi:hypothetical protein